MTKQLEILLVEDREEFSKVAKEVIENKGYKVEITNYLKDAEKQMEQKNYDFVLIDGFFPYSKERMEKWPKNTSKEEDEKMDRWAKEILGGRGDVADYLAISKGAAEAPCGLMLAKKIKYQGKKNYLIVSAADHHKGTDYYLLRDYASFNDLNLYVEDLAFGNGVNKATKEYWEKALEKMNVLIREENEGGKENGN
jgi:CheY-like chemotaxis protein